MISRVTRQLLMALGSLALLTSHAEAQAAEANPQDLVSRFWMASSAEEQRRSRDALLAFSTEPDVLYRLLRNGPTYGADVPTGQQERARIAVDGTRYPYVYLVPEDYDPARAYPVEFHLHGGVSRPEWEPGGGWWRRGYDALSRPDRIVVVPASWLEHFWWQENQAENLPAILKELKRRYNIDENRVTLSGVSDGGTGAFFFAFKQPTEWAAFLPYIGHPGVLRNAQSGGGYRLYFENLLGRPLYIVNGENDRLYPASSVQPFIDILVDASVPHVYRVIEDGGHNTRWLPEETPRIEEFKTNNPRDPLPDSISWVADRTDRFNRHAWIRVDEMIMTPGLLEVSRAGNGFDVEARGVSAFTLLLNPQEVDFAQAVQVTVNGELTFDGTVSQDAETLLTWARRDLDRTMLFSAELSIRVEE